MKFCCDQSSYSYGKFLLIRTVHMQCPHIGKVVLVFHTLCSHQLSSVAATAASGHHCGISPEWSCRDVDTACHLPGVAGGEWGSPSALSCEAYSVRCGSAAPSSNCSETRPVLFSVVCLPFFCDGARFGKVRFGLFFSALRFALESPLGVQLGGTFSGSSARKRSHVISQYLVF